MKTTPAPIQRLMEAKQRRQERVDAMTNAIHATDVCPHGVTERASEVDQAMIDVGNANGQMEKLVHTLKERLNPVLRCDTPSSGKDAPDSPTACYTAPLAQRISTVSENIRGQVRVLEDVLRLLEV